MQKFLTALCTAALVIVMTGVAIAEVQSIKVSGDIRTYGAYRRDFDLADRAASDDDQDWINTATRLRVDADLTDNVSTTVRLLNERDWGIEETALSSDGNTDVSIDLANVALKDFLYSPLTVTIGRQELRYGNALVVGDVDGNAFSRATGLLADEWSRRKAFDAIRLVLDFDPIVVDGFHALIDETGTTSEDWTLTGLDVAYAFGSYDASVAAYFVWSHNNSEATTSPPQLGGSWSTDTAHGMSVYTIGFRGNVEPVTGLDLGAEVALQGGDYSNTRDQDASAFQLTGAYTFDASLKPVLRGAFVYFSGEEAGDTGDQESWLATFEDQTWGIIADRMQLTSISGGTPQSASTNMYIINLGGSIQPLDDITLSADWYIYTLVEENDATAGAGAGTSSTYSNDDEYGNEVDIALRYDYTEDVTIDSTLAFFSPGDAFESDAQDTATQLTGGVTVVF